MLCWTHDASQDPAGRDLTVAGFAPERCLADGPEHDVHRSVQQHLSHECSGSEPVIPRRMAPAN
jgi:hypothetical protein